MNLTVYPLRESRWSRLASPRAARGLGVVLLLLTAAGVALTVVSRAQSSGLPLVPFGIVGYIVARRQPRNPLGWVLLGLGLDFLLASDAGQYSYLVYRQGYQLPLARVAVFLAAFWIWLILLAPLPIALFPDGRLSGRWRWVVRIYLGLCAIVVARFTWSDATGIAARRIRIDAQGELATTGGGGGGGVLALAFVAFWLAFVIRQVLNYRGSKGEYRQQLKWLLAGGTTTIAGLLLTLSFGGSNNSGLSVLGGSGFVALMALPIGMGVGILKYRLYDIDRLISRTLSYLIVTGLLAGVFFGIVVLATRVMPFSSPVGVAASTLAAAALFNPLRLRVQRLVDRRFNRARYDAEAIVAAFGARLRDAVELETVRDELEHAIRRAVEPTHVSLWIRS